MARVALDERDTEMVFHCVYDYKYKSFVRQTKKHLEELFQVQTVSKERDCLKSCWYRSWRRSMHFKISTSFLAKKILEA